jgi:hypothetical protein
MIGFCPEIAVNSPIALSRLLELVFASPIPIFKEMDKSFGTSIALSYENRDIILGTTTST